MFSKIYLWQLLESELHLLRRLSSVLLVKRVGSSESGVDPMDIYRCFVIIIIYFLFVYLDA